MMKDRAKEPTATHESGLKVAMYSKSIGNLEECKKSTARLTDKRDQVNLHSGKQMEKKNKGYSSKGEKVRKNSEKRQRMAEK